MSLSESEKKELARKALLYVQICRKCSARNPMNAKNCRRCRSTRLRPKRRERAG
ncbi:MAG: 50S ribosomal protein L40e [Promethearchaeota archaeon]